MGHLNDILARVGGNLNKKFQKSQMPGGLPGGGGMLKLRFDRYIKRVNNRDEVAVCHFQRPFTFKTITRKNICYQYWSRYLQRVGNRIRIFGGLLLSKGSLLKVGTHKAVCRCDTSLRQTIPWKKVVQ